MMTADVQQAPDMDVQQTAKELEALMGRFEREHPETAQALRVMNLPFEQYLRALAALQGESSMSGNAAA
jgi:hypothetical protein